MQGSDRQQPTGVLHRYRQKWVPCGDPQRADPPAPRRCRPAYRARTNGKRIVQGLWHSHFHDRALSLALSSFLNAAGDDCQVQAVKYSRVHGTVVATRLNGWPESGLRNRGRIPLGSRTHRQDLCIDGDYTLFSIPLLSLTPRLGLRGNIR